MKAIMPNVDNEDKILMEKLLLAGHIAHQYARRLQIITHSAQGKSAQEIAISYGVGRSTVSTI
jgi:DNA-binding CsgD family transcriptional regulator